MPAVQKILLRILDRNQMNAKFLIKKVKNYNHQIIRELRAYLNSTIFNSPPGFENLMASLISIVKCN